MCSYHQLLDRLCQIQLRDRWGLIVFDPRANNNKRVRFSVFKACTDGPLPPFLVARRLGAYLGDLNHFPIRSLPTYGPTLG